MCGCVNVCVHINYMHAERMVDPLELELQEVMSS